MEQLACMEVVSMPAGACPKRSGRKLTAGKRSLTQSTACTEDDRSPAMSPVTTPLVADSMGMPSDAAEYPFIRSFSGSPLTKNWAGSSKTPLVIIEEAERVRTPLPPGLEECSPASNEEGEAVALVAVSSSVGSVLHGSGECRPCAWFYKPNGCQNGAECRYCHACPQGEIKARKKNKVEALRSRKDSLGSASSPEPPRSQAKQPAHVSATTHMSGAHEELKLADLSLPPGLMDPKSLGNGLLGTSVETEEGVCDSSSESEVVPLASVGSALHATGTCRPCAWFYKPEGCANGAECRHCHSCPEGAIRERRKTKVSLLRKQTSQEQAVDMEQSLWAVQQHQEAMIWASLQVQAMWGAAAAGAHAAFSTLAAQPPPPPEPMSPMSVPVLAEDVPDSPASDLPSKGSALHALGTCKPCAWLWKPAGCQNGKDCEHCHACPPGELKERKRIKAAKRGDAAVSARLGEPAIIKRLPRPIKIDSALLC